jgi:DNA-binding NarL/FixJ family response regulator
MANGQAVEIDAPGGDEELRILVVDDHKSFAELLSSALTTVQGMRCIGTASSAAEGVARAAELKPDVVVMDIQMPRQDGLAATRRIRELSPDSVVAIVTAHDDPQWISRAAQAGASAFIPKNGSLSEMISVLRSARAGQMLVAPTAFAGGERRRVASDVETVPDLSQRELQVLQQLAQGIPAKLMAPALGITVHTCRGYIKSVRQKLGVSSQLEALIKAQQLGLIDPTPGH